MEQSRGKNGLATAPEPSSDVEVSRCGSRRVLFSRKNQIGTFLLKVLVQRMKGQKHFQP